MIFQYIDAYIYTHIKSFSKCSSNIVCQCILCLQNYIVRKKAKKSDSAAQSSDNGEVTEESSQLIIPSITRDEKVYQPGE